MNNFIDLVLIVGGSVGAVASFMGMAFFVDCGYEKTAYLLLCICVLSAALFSFGVADALTLNNKQDYKCVDKYHYGYFYGGDVPMTTDQYQQHCGK